MTDAFNLSFTNNEHELYMFLKGMKNASGFLKDCIKSYQASGEKPVVADSGEVTDSTISGLFERVYGDIITDYGGEYQFIRVQNECQSDILATMQNRKKMLKIACSNDIFLIDTVTDYAKEKLPRLSRFI